VLGGGREAPSGGGRRHRRVAAAASLFWRGGDSPRSVANRRTLVGARRGGRRPVG
jgi:hypothetical protein